VGLPCDQVQHLPEPAWLAGQSDPVIDAMLDALSDEARGLYRQYLAEEIRSARASEPVRAWRAFDRALFEVLRRQEARQG
jgi:hypothetical protein